MESKLLQQRQDKVEKSWFEARNSGIALMSTVIGLSSAALYVTDKNDLPFFLNIVYGVPIFLALLQELFHYKASMISANLREAILFYDLQEEESPEGVMMMGVAGMMDEKNTHFRKADKLCAFAVYTFLFAIVVNLFTLLYIR